MLINAYHMVVSPWLGTRCRFTPTCSEYAKQALDEHNIVSATLLTSKRICRCHPWGGHGHDPVPPTKNTARPSSANNRKLAIKEET